jgi:hypothetical protein
MTLSLVRALSILLTHHAFVPFVSIVNSLSGKSLHSSLDFRFSCFLEANNPKNRDRNRSRVAALFGKARDELMRLPCGGNREREYTIDRREPRDLVDGDYERFNDDPTS